MSGKMALMPLPAAEPGGRRTSTWGGTMMGITKKCKNRELAYQLAEHMYYHPEQMAENFRSTNIVPPIRDAWNHEAFREPREYWSGQPIGTLYAALAKDVPPQFTNAFITTAKAKMAQALSSSVSYYSEHGEDGFVEHVRATLKRVADEVRFHMARNPF